MILKLFSKKTPEKDIISNTTKVKERISSELIEEIKNTEVSQNDIDTFICDINTRLSSWIMENMGMSKVRPLLIKLPVWIKLDNSGTIIPNNGSQAVLDYITNEYGDSYVFEPQIRDSGKEFFLVTIKQKTSDEENK